MRGHISLNMKIRIDGRPHDKIRPINVTYNIFEYAAGSVLFELGKTKVLCSVMFEQGVPKFLKGSGQGWLTAEYSLLPAATKQRMQRDSTNMKANGRSLEISRLIGRSIRSVVDVSHIGENTIWIDCDVVQADGGTRTASINAAYLALKKAEERLLEEKRIKGPLLKDQIASISAGIFKGDVLLDLNCEEDNLAEADLNFVLTKSGKVVEIQGTAEGEPIPWADFEKIKDVVQKGIKQIFAAYSTLKI